MDVLAPQNTDEVIDAISGAGASGTALEIIGLGSKRGWGHKVQADTQLSTKGLTGITLYEPEELVISLRAGTPMTDLEAALTENGQHLAFEPPDLGPLYGRAAGVGTIGGTIACNLAGPRRIDAGFARDHILGFKAINGRGENFKSGGRVVKNVTGFDLSKLMTHSFGTLAVMTDVTLKVLPAPPATKTLLLMDQTPTEAVAAMAEAYQLPYSPTGSAYLSASLSPQDGRAITAIRFEGWQGSLAHRLEATLNALAVSCETIVLETEAAKALWQWLRDGAPFVHDQRQIWQLSVPPTRAADVSQAILQQAEGDAYFEGSGLIWLGLTPSGDAEAELVRQVTRAARGSATLLRADETVRDKVAVFEPQPAPLRAITEEVRASFDPLGILNPGRMGGAM